MRMNQGLPAPPRFTPLLMVLLALLSAFTPLSIDMYLPALPTITADLRATAGDLQLTLSAFMLAFGFGQIFYGPAGDRFGRRPVILAGIATYVVASIGCAFAAAADQLVLLRFLQGLAACGSVVLARTMVRDLAEGDQAARAMSLIMACTSMAPMVAPLIGSQVLAFWGWRAIFWVLAGIGVVGLVFSFLRLPESLRPDYRQPLAVVPVLRRFRELLGHRAFMGYALTSTFQFAALMSYLSGVPFVFIEVYGVSPTTFGIIFAGVIVMLTTSNLLNARFAPVLGSATILRHAAIVPAVAGTGMLVLGLIEVRTGAIGLWPFLIFLVPHLAMMALVVPNATVLALQSYPHMAGTASSFMGVMQYGVGALFGVFVGQAFNGTILPMAIALATSGVLCLVSHRLMAPRS
ncbi:MAG: Bcr/CflA family multidrug efflux MFS transporter [Alphaproteobacteria bacterium]|nr:Bcr/CflA family multidrug efflux MFS transporter [Alphaproteobacteria bacterium]